MKKTLQTAVPVSYTHLDVYKRQTLPRGSGRYISSFLGFAPAEDPKVLALCIIYAPQGMYYGGIIAAPVVRSIFENVLPYLGIERTVTETPFGENRADGVD